MKKIIYILAILILCFMTTSAGTVKAATTIIVPDHYPTIQQAINAANPGDTIYVCAGTYMGYLIITKPLTLEGEDRETTIIDGTGSLFGIRILNTSGVTIRNLTVRNFFRGIWLQNCSEISIVGNKITANNFGIFLSSSDNNIISNNAIANNAVVGINLASSIENTITGNTICGNTGWGIFLAGAKKNQIYNNNFIDNVVHAMTSLDCSGTVFNLDKPTGGNYWDTWTGPDVDPEDGFVDFAYVYGGVKDNLPWTKPDGWKSSPATVDVKPDTLNLSTKGKWVTAYIELEEGFNVADIDISTVTLNHEVSAQSRPNGIGDYDEDGIPDLMVKFDRASVQEVLDLGDEVDVTIRGKLTGGASFKGTDTIRVIDEGGG